MVEVLPTICTTGTDQRLILDLMWFIVVLVVFINIIFGIVIDTFSSLRALKMARQENTLYTCFICSINRQTFDRADDEPDGFKRHITNDHNMCLPYFIFFLWEQDKDDIDGFEYYVHTSCTRRRSPGFRCTKLCASTRKFPQKDYPRSKFIGHCLSRCDHTESLQLSSRY